MALSYKKTDKKIIKKIIKLVIDPLRRYFLYPLASPINTILKRSYDNNALAQLIQLPGPFIPFSDSAIRPGGLLVVLNDILVNQRKIIFELGSGNSTIYIARLLKQYGGHLYSVEHDEKWADWIRGKLIDENTDAQVTVIFAPLVDTISSLDDSLWYDFEAIKEHIEDVKIDLLLVDGPPAYNRNSTMSRYPAVPVLKSFFSDCITIILDDIERKGEQKIIDKWEDQLCCKFDQHYFAGGIAIGYLGRHFNVIGIDQHLYDSGASGK